MPKVICASHQKVSRFHFYFSDKTFFRSSEVNVAKKRSSIEACHIRPANTTKETERRKKKKLCLNLTGSFKITEKSSESGEE